VVERIIEFRRLCLIGASGAAQATSHE
jgi:hypothetical protein